MGPPRTRLDTAANGFAHVTTEDQAEYKRLASLLVWRHGFIRFGFGVPAYGDEAIYPSFVRWRTTIVAGWDNWSGYYLLANSARADRFLRGFFAKHCLPGGVT